MKKTTALLCALAISGAASAAAQKPAAAKNARAAEGAKASPGTARASEAARKESKMVKTESGLGYEDLVVGTGASPETGQTCVMHYTGWLFENGAKGAKFDSSVDRNQPFEFQIGRGRVIKGWDEGVSTMKVGGKRTLLIPPQLGYGDRGAGNVIPPGATLLFEVELLGLK
ncbi:MAG: FKBP-type peptidyl-prolyl cis-trans isomerase [Thermoanaerobaculia bacterium]